MFETHQQSRSAIKFIQSLFVNSSRHLEARVLKATAEHALWWAKHVQPAIQCHPERPDRTWDWIALVNGATPVLRFARLSGQELHPYCIATQDASGDLVIAGMVLLAEPYPFLMDHQKSAPFLWFLAAAPAEFLCQRLRNDRPRLLQALVDICIVFSHEKNYQGRVGLHADPKGGDKLAQGYQRCGLRALPAEVKLPLARQFLRIVATLGGAETTGSYFYADTDHAEDILRLSDHLRTYPPGTEMTRKAT